MKEIYADHALVMQLARLNRRHALSYYWELSYMVWVQSGSVSRSGQAKVKWPHQLKFGWDRKIWRWYCDSFCSQVTEELGWCEWELLSKALRLL